MGTPPLGHRHHHPHRLGLAPEAGIGNHPAALLTVFPAKDIARIFDRRWAQIGLTAGIFLLLSVYFATETLVVFLKRGIPVSFFEELRMRLLQWMPWALLTFPVLRFVGRHPLDKKTWPSSLPLHLLAGLGFSLRNKWMS